MPDMVDRVGSLSNVDSVFIVGTAQIGEPLTLVSAVDLINIAVMAGAVSMSDVADVPVDEGRGET